LPGKEGKSAMTPGSSGPAGWKGETAHGPFGKGYASLFEKKKTKKKKKKKKTPNKGAQTGRQKGYSGYREGDASKEAIFPSKKKDSTEREREEEKFLAQNGVFVPKEVAKGRSALTKVPRGPNT